MKYLITLSKRLWSLLGRLSADRYTTVFLVGLLAFFCCVFTGWHRGLPLPRIHDEFSYLLAADTFASGRLTNPTHPLWKHFESMHEISKPSYMSKYPPMQGIFLAAGQKFFGHPIVGVWLSMALMCSAICWMLQAWFSSRWALVGSLIVIFHPAIGAASYWAQSYWGGAVAGMGGGMIFGAIRRIARELNVFDAVIMGLGMTVVFNSRPFEGVPIITLVSLLVVYGILIGKKKSSKSYIRVVALPLIIIGLLTIAAMGYYNKVVTGNVFVMPYMVYEQAYSNTPIFVWQKLRPEPVFNNDEMRLFNMDENQSQFFKYSQKNLLSTVRERWNAVIFPGVTGDNLLLFPFLLSFFAFFSGNKWIVAAWGIVLSYILVQATVIFFHFHYIGPYMALFVAFIIYGFRILMCFKVGDLWIGKIMTVIYLGVILCSGFMQMEHPTQQNIWKSLDNMDNLQGNSDYAWYKQRQKIICYLNAIGGKHLVLVKYNNLHSVYNEWVYNKADIDKATVVWARDLGPKANEKLFDYFKDRTVWILTVNKDDSSVEFMKRGDSPNLFKAEDIYLKNYCTACL